MSGNLTNLGIFTTRDARLVMNHEARRVVDQAVQAGLPSLEVLSCAYWDAHLLSLLWGGIARDSGLQVLHIAEGLTTQTVEQFYSVLNKSPRLRRFVWEVLDSHPPELFDSAQ